MIFLAFTEQGLDTKPIVAASVAAAADIARQRYSSGVNGDGVTPVNVALIVPQLSGQVNPAATPAQATITTGGDSANQAILRQSAQTALSNNASYLGLASPTTVQAVAQVAALTRQMDGVIRFLLGDFSSTS